MTAVLPSCCRRPNRRISRCGSSARRRRCARRRCASCGIGLTATPSTRARHTPARPHVRRRRPSHAPSRRR
eukprot:1742994-Prymnesium_polylepis.1